MQSKKDPTPQQMTPRGEKEKLNDKVKVILRVRPFVEVEDPEEFISAQEVLPHLSRKIPSLSTSPD
jgi:hypothetical protein